MTKSRAVLVLLLPIFFLAGGHLSFAADAPGSRVDPITTFTAGKTPSPGILTVYRDPTAGGFFLEIPNDEKSDFLYQATLVSGFGHRSLRNANFQHLDRGLLGPTRLVTFRRYGTRVLLIERNTNYFTPSAEFGTTSDTGFFFPNSVVASLEIKAENATRVVVDATSLFLRDDIGVANDLKLSGQGTFQFDKALSAIDDSSLNNSDRGLEIQSLLSFTSADGSSEKDVLEGVAQDRNSILVREQHALIRLADLKQSPYRTREFDPRVGYFDLTFHDPSRLPWKSTTRSLIKRHHLARIDPTSEVSEPQRPIVFNIDPSIPPELRPLVREAIGWWNSAFEVAGFRNAIQVMDLPQGANPLSIGTNAIIWIPRATRGFSFGTIVADPRTGEILKSTVRLDAMRLKADQLLFDAITAPYNDSSALAARDDALRQRFKMLVAHEIGHTLGLRHQYAGSAENNSSVMDYPFPNIDQDSDGKPILRQVFPQGIGEWDKLTIGYGYKQLPPDQEAVELRRLAEAIESRSLYWQGDEDADDAQPSVQRWDRGTDPIAELNGVMALRQTILQRFSRNSIPGEEPLAALQDALVPVYLLHQFAVKPVAAMLGGYSYQYSLRDQTAPVAVSPDAQRQALQALFSTLDPERLNVGNRLLALMSPRPVNYASGIESFSGRTGAIFDAVRPIENAAALTMAEILKPERAERLAQAASRDVAAPDLAEVLVAIIGYTWKQPPRSGDFGLTQRAIAGVVIQSILGAMAQKKATTAVTAACWLALEDLESWMQSHPATDEWRATYALTRNTIAAFRRDPSKFTVPDARLPQVAPMGAADGP